MRLIISAVLVMFVSFSNGGLTGGAFSPLPIGGGGFVTNLVIAPNGVQLARTDTAGMFARNSHTSVWTRVLTAYSMPTADQYIGNGYGVCEIAIAPSNPNHFYAYFAPYSTAQTNSYLYSSTNSGGTWARVGTATFPTSDVCPANDQGNPSYRLKNSFMAVSPADENAVYVGTHASGIYYSLDGGATWTQISTATIPAGGSAGDTNQGNLIAFDPSDATGNTFYATSYGNGVWKCTGALTGPSCTKLSSTGMPTTMNKMVVDMSGTVWLIDGADGQQGNLLRYLSGTWTTQVTFSSSNKTEFGCVAVNPANSSLVYAVDYHGNVTYSSNGQVTNPIWNGATTFTETSSIIGWLQWSSDQALSIQNCQFDPSQSNVLYAGAGVGVFTTSPPTSGVPNVAWQGDQTQGIENLDLTASSIPLSGGGLGFAAQDRPAWYLTSYTSYPSQYYPNNLTEIRLGTTVCGNPTPNTYGNLNNSDGLAVSTSGPNGTYTVSGKTGLPGGFSSGNCIMLTSSNWIWMGNAAGVLQPYFTNNSGSSWSACTFGGGKTVGGGGWVAIAQDSAGTVMLYNDGSGATNGAGAAGSWESPSSTACAFTQNSTTKPATNLTLLLPVPGNPCNFVFASLAYIWGGLPGTGNVYLTQNCGLTWGTAISGVNSIVALGIGAPQTGHDGYASLYYQGYYNNGTTNVFGLWEVDNIDSMPVVTDLDPNHSGTQKGFPCGNMDFVEFIQGDAVTPGKVSFGFEDSGACYRTNFLLKRDVAPASTDNDPMWLEKAA